jgi:hypothetical protein
MALLTVLSLAAPACEETSVMVYLHSALRIPEELDALCVQVAAGGEFDHASRHPLSEGGLLSLSVVPGERHNSFFELLLRGERRGMEASWARMGFTFEEGKIQEQHVTIDRCTNNVSQGTFAPVQYLTNVPDGAVAAVPIASAPSEVVVAWSKDAQRFAYLNDKVWQIKEGLPIVEDGPVHKLLAVDVDMDCDLDLVVLQQKAPQIWLHGADGTFQQLAGAVLFQGDFTDVAAADINLDGHVDLVLVSSAETKLLLNNRQPPGTFRDASTLLPPGLDDVTSVDIGFINLGSKTERDSYPDIVLARGSTTAQATALLINKYGGNPDSVSFERSDLAETYVTRSVAVADLDRNNLHDVVLGVEGGPPVVYLNTSTESTVQLELRSDVLQDAGSETVHEVLARDINDDCWVDVVLARASATAVLLNNRQGKLIAPVSSTPLPRAGRLATSDVDGDGKLDLVLGGESVGASWLRQEQ